jgi:hypothetical protein
MGYWQNTTYLEHGNPAAVADAMEALFLEEGMPRMARAAPREPARFDPMQYAQALENNL